LQKKWIYEILGRMCHLLGDMSVPAHVHCNSHAGLHGMYSDLYEINAPNFHLWTADEIFAQSKTFIDPITQTWSDPLYYLMYFMNQITDHYASGKTDGNDIYDPNCPGLSDIFPTLGAPKTIGDVNYANVASMHDVLFPMAIRVTAGLLYWFAVQTHQVIPTYNITFQNSFVGIGNGGIIIVNGTQSNSPAASTVVEQNPITATAVDQTISAIDYEFIGWYDGPASDLNANRISTENPHTFYPGGHATYYAHFVGTPNVSLMRPYSNDGTVGAKPTIYWTDNTNTNVSYKIYRQVKENGIWGDWHFAANVNKGVGHFSDGEFRNVAGHNMILALRMNAYYSTEATSMTGGTASFDADWFISPEKRNFGNNEISAITEYKLYDNFPNPFNPSTEITYQIPNDGNVKLKVYNIMGQEVMTLVNEFKEKGMYSVSFNAGSLTSGVYIYKLEAGNYVQVKKMILTK
jgi:hypothetical protein